VTTATPRTAPQARRHLWTRCPGCRRTIMTVRKARLEGVCPSCGHHDRLPATDRLAALLDPGSLTPLPFAVRRSDPLGFRDVLPYPERLRAAASATGLAEAVVAAAGTIEGTPVVCAAMDFRFLGGSLGCAAGELLTLAMETALERKAPFVVLTASGGARMQEGVLSLMQMAKTSQALAALDEAGLLTVALVTEPTFGGVAASFATSTDVILAEPGARLGFAGPRVIEETIGERLPDGFQRAEFLLEHGLIDAVVPRRELRRTLACLLRAAQRPAPRPRPAPDPAALVRDPARLDRRDPWETVQAARDPARPGVLDFALYEVPDLVQLHGDRVSGDCEAVVGGVGTFRGRPIVLIGHQKGGGTAERVRRRFGMGTPQGYRKAGRLLRLAAKLGLPVVTIVNTPGAYPGVEAEAHGQALAIAENIKLMSGLPVPVVTVITGEGGSGGALGLAVANRVLVCQNACYSVISPEGCAAILWKSGQAARTAAAALRLDAAELLRMGVADAIVPETGDERPAALAARIGDGIEAMLAELLPMDPDELVADRRSRFRGYGRDAAHRLPSPAHERV